MERPQRDRPLDIEFAKELYLEELENKHKLDSRMPTLVIIMTAIAGLLYYSVHEFALGPSWFNIIVALLIAAATLLYILAFIALIRGTLGHTYAVIPKMSELKETFRELQEYHRRHPGRSGTAAGELDEDLIERMLQATDRNRHNNLTRGARYYIAMLLMAGSLTAALLGSGVVTGAEKFREIQRKEKQMADEQKPAESPQASDTPAQPAASGSGGTEAAPDRPTLPENTLFKGNDIPPKDTTIMGVEKRRGGK